MDRRGDETAEWNRSELLQPDMEPSSAEDDKRPSSVASQKLEWDSMADVGYQNVNRASTSADDSHRSVRSSEARLSALRKNAERNMLNLSEFKKSPRMTTLSLKSKEGIKLIRVIPKNQTKSNRSQFNLVLKQRVAHIMALGKKSINNYDNDISFANINESEINVDVMAESTRSSRVQDYTSDKGEEIADSSEAEFVDSVPREYTTNSLTSTDSFDYVQMNSLIPSPTVSLKVDSNSSRKSTIHSNKSIVSNEDFQYPLACSSYQSYNENLIENPPLSSARSKTNDLIERLVSMRFNDPEKRLKAFQMIKALIECFDNLKKSKKKLDKETQSSFLTSNDGKSRFIKRDAKISNEKMTQTDIFGHVDNFNVSKVSQRNETVDNNEMSHIDNEFLSIIKHIKLLKSKIKNNRDSLHYPTLLKEVQCLLKKCQNIQIETPKAANEKENFYTVNSSKQQENNDNSLSKNSQKLKNIMNLNEHAQNEIDVRNNFFSRSEHSSSLASRLMTEKKDFSAGSNMSKTEIQVKQTSDKNQSYCSDILNDIRNKIKRLENNEFDIKTCMDQATQISTPKLHKDDTKFRSYSVEEMEKQQEFDELISRSGDSIADDNVHTRDNYEKLHRTVDVEKYWDDSTDEQINSSLLSDNRLNNSVKNVHCVKNIRPTLREYLAMNNPAFIQQACTRHHILKEISAHRSELQMEQKRQLEERIMKFSNIKNLSGSNFTKAILKENTNQSRNSNILHLNSRDIKKNTYNKYKLLPEVKQKEEVSKKNVLQRHNLIKTKLFNKRLQRKTLNGEVDIPLYSNLI